MPGPDGRGPRVLAREDGGVPAARAEPSAEPCPLVHVLLVGGTLADWDALGEEGWRRRVATLGDAAAAAGCRWLTLHPYEAGTSAAPAVPALWTVTRDGCTVIVDAEPDGRQRLVRGLARLTPSAPLDEATLTAAVLAPAEVDPDLVVVLGPRDRLPPSLVWELAYSELVYLDVTWAELGAEHLQVALEEYRHRERRFGGVSA